MNSPRCFRKAAAFIAAGLFVLAVQNAFSCDTIGGCTGNELRCYGSTGVAVPSSNFNRLDSAFTLECWFRDSAFTQQMGVIGKGTAAGPSFGLIIDSLKRIILEFQGASGYKARVISKTGLANGTWRHVAIIRQADNVELIVDEHLIGSAVFPASETIVSNAALLIGQDQTLNSGLLSFVGSIDEVRLWFGVVDSSLLLCRRFARLTGNEQGLLAYYPFDDSLFRTITCDRSPNQNNGTLGSGAAIGTSTRSVPSPINVLESTLSLGSVIPCFDSVSGIVHILSNQACGSRLYSVTLDGPDRNYFLIPAISDFIGPGDTAALTIQCQSQSSALHADVKIVAEGCPDTIVIPISAPPRPSAPLSINRDSLFFLTNGVGSRSGDTVIVQNNGNAPDTITVLVSGLPFSVDSITTIIVPPFSNVAIPVSFTAPDDSLHAGVLTISDNTCGQFTIDLISVSGTPITNQLCADQLQCTAGDTAKIALRFSQPLNLTTSDTLFIRFEYDARQIAPLYLTSLSSGGGLDDHPGPNAYATTEIFGSQETLDSLFTHLLFVALAADSETAAITIQAHTTSPPTTLLPCTSQITVLPRCDIPSVRYNPLVSNILAISPNPVENSGTFFFSLGEVAHATVALYDMFGRKLSTLLDTELRPGVHSAAIDASALKLLPGSYYVSIVAGTLHDTRRVTVLR